MSILKEHISHMEKDQLNFHQSELTSFFLTALDFRAEHCQVSPKLLRVDLISGASFFFSAVLAAAQTPCFSCDLRAIWRRRRRLRAA